VHARQRPLSFLSLYLAAVMALPWPVALPTVEAAPPTVPVLPSALHEAGVKLRLRVADPYHRALLDSATFSSLLDGVDDDERDDDSLLVIGLGTFPGMPVLWPPSAAVASARWVRVLTSPAPEWLHLRC